MRIATSTGRGGDRVGAGRPQGSRNADLPLRDVYLKARIRLVEIDVAEREGRLIDAGQAKEQQTRASMVARDGILSVPPRICHDIAALGGDADAIERMMTDALRAELTRIAQGDAEG